MTVLDSVKNNRPLYVTALGMLILSALFIAGLFLDERMILGLNPWVKPLKFSISIFIYVLTMIYILRLHETEKNKSYSQKIAVTMWIEMILIAGQSLRGVPSHFNDAKPIDGIVFGLMGLAIAYNTYLMARIAYDFFKSPPARILANELLAIRLGLILFLIGAIEGGYMSSHKGHTVGAGDGGPGLPFLNWSTVAGDLRVTHFLGLHGIQILLSVTFLASAFLNRSSKNRKLDPTRGAIYVVFFSILSLTFLTLAQALAGRPILS